MGPSKEVVPRLLPAAAPWLGRHRCFGTAPSFSINYLALRFARVFVAQARVITEASRPFRITHVNDAWVGLCGFTLEEAQGQTLRILQGEATDLTTVDALVKDCQEGRSTSMEVINYDKQGHKFRNFLKVYPLAAGGNGPDKDATTHLLGVLTPMGPKFE